ncbi:acetyl-CoA synthetase [Pseudonocardia hierapolitana]|uniref:Acetyl-CoA synthetase n=1 Tax=Pseudonocardia hierapolitana TaxID=1128676 RepID=A0A561SS02_9PSEU|nr:AMP-binding protein [Pseudonocardia hierapolitana]TWF77605.1 acetyl-CoA synthetase [Pseudonocardia hierapolitana]
MNGRTAVADRVWQQVEAGLSRDPGAGLNTAQEVCGRYASAAGRLALVVRHADGSAERWTYGELDRAAARAAAVFARAGLRRGDRVAGLLSRQAESWITAVAAWRSGLVYVPLFCGFGTDALAVRLRSSGARLVVADHRWRAGLDDALAALDPAPEVLTVTPGRRSAERSFWAELDAVTADGPAVETAASDLATLLFTSGTTGEPKACAMPHSALLAVLPFARYGLGVGRRDLLFTSADPGWAYGLYSAGAAPMALGVPRVIYDGDFDPDAWWRLMREERVTCVAGAPSAYRRLLGPLAQQGVPAELRAAAAAGEPLDADTAQRWTAAGAPAIRDGYGLSEIGMVLCDLADGAAPLAGTLGGPLPGFAVTLVDASGAPVPEGTSGLVAIRRPRYTLTAGYENRPEAWTARWQDDLFVTDDRAVVRPDGRWQFLGREGDIIVTRGYNVGPVEVERVIGEHPAVAEVAVVAAPGTRGGTVVRAVLVAADPAVPRDEVEQAVRETVARRIGPHASPRVVDWTDALPRNEVGKLQRARLRSSS